jgi:DNA-binding response OmpR family regulator
MGRVLIIDDEELMRETLRDALESEGHVVAEAADGAQGLAIFDNAPVDVVIVDMLMPDKEGIETIIDLRKRKPKLKIVAMSGGGATNRMDFLDIARKLGADGALRKPINVGDLLKTVQSLLSTTMPS